MMPSILEELFQMSGRRLQDYMELQEIDPLYTLKFGDLTFSPSRNKEKMKAEMEAKFPGSFSGYKKFMKVEREILVL